MFKYLKKKHHVSSLLLLTISAAAFVLIILLLIVFQDLANETAMAIILAAFLMSGLIIGIVGMIIWLASANENSDAATMAADSEASRQRLIDDLQNEKKYFAGILSHDLRSPLSSVILLASYLKSKNENSETSHYIQLVEQSSKKELEMMSTLLTLMRTDSFKPENLEEVDFKGMAEQVIHDLESQLSRKLLSIRLKISSDATVVAEPMALSLILKSVINQAIHYSDPEQTIEVVFSESDKFITIEVEIQSHELPKISIENLVASDRLTSQTAVSGFPDRIDLYFSQQALKHYNGTIRVQADGNGPTCRFILTLERLTTPNSV